jgi:hypothetical protein
LHLNYVIVKLFIISIIHHADIDSNTHIKDHVIQLFAFLVFSSSQFATRYIIQLSMRDITAIIATYCINVEIKSHHISHAVSFIFLLSPGNHRLSGKSFHSNVLVSLAKVLEL